MSKKPPTFEESLAELEGIIQQLESGELPLDQMMQQYENGVRALQTCRTILDQAEKKIELLIKTKNGQLRAEPYEPDTGEDVAD